jgi:hypothetical protein
MRPSAHKPLQKFFASRPSRRQLGEEVAALSTQLRTLEASIAATNSAASREMSRTRQQITDLAVGLTSVVRDPLPWSRPLRLFMTVVITAAVTGLAALAARALGVTNPSIELAAVLTTLAGALLVLATITTQAVQAPELDRRPRIRFSLEVMGFATAILGAAVSVLAGVALL